MPHRSFSRAFIFTGGRLWPQATAAIRPDDYLIGADGGAAFLVAHGITPHLALGDFDSVDGAAMNAIAAAALELRAFDPLDKDWTDTELAYNEAAGRGFGRIVIAGALGTRFDHSLGNVQLLATAAEQGRELTLLDEHNEIRLCADRMQVVRDDRFPYLSLLPLDGTVTGVTLNGFRYPLLDATLRVGQSLGISNALEADTGTIAVAGGRLLVIRSRD